MDAATAKTKFAIAANVSLSALKKKKIILKSLHLNVRTLNIDEHQHGKSMPSLGVQVKKIEPLE